MVQRLTYRKRHSYATKSNQHRVVKTPENIELGNEFLFLFRLVLAIGLLMPVSGEECFGWEFRIRYDFFCRVGWFPQNLGLQVTAITILQIAFNCSFLYKAQSGGAGFDGIFTFISDPSLETCRIQENNPSLLGEEQKIVKKVLKIQKSKEKQASKS
ncbi:hypothetical protein POTOM_060501 [Populus tomentosa]|uniref:Uncharacterized protein n=1 Tax=Populus tomentosa TaxID=118781 RepID=A0A8X7XUJ1_POPTO|nr:hypothetical protein POTOM_060501 [Populus tomentosa]